MSNPFDDRHVVVTGGTGALGRAVVERLVSLGATVHVPCFHLHELEGFALAEHERVKVSGGVDLRSEPVVEAYYGEIYSPWASVHVAGGFSMAPVTEVSLDEFENMWRMNVVTCFVCCREAVRRMCAGSDGGRIVNVAARPALAPCGGMIAYTTAKAAVASMTQCLAEEVKGDRILVNAIAPSIMNTPANRDAMPEADHESWPKVNQVAKVIVDLASIENELTSGAIVPVYGVV